MTNNIFLPYYTPFIPEERYNQLKVLMNDNGGNSFYMKLGKTASTVKGPKYLRFCSKCLNADQTENGESYWHRTHQAEGVMVCPLHNTCLIESKVR